MTACTRPYLMESRKMRGHELKNMKPKPMRSRKLIAKPTAKLGIGGRCDRYQDLTTTHFAR